MNPVFRFAVCAIVLVLVSVRTAADLARFETRDAVLTIDDRGTVRSLVRHGAPRELIATHRPAPIASVQVAGRLHAPSDARWDAAAGRLVCRYGEIDAVVILAVTAKPTHVVFEVVAATPHPSIELLLWGPYPIAIGETIGEIIGVARDAEAAVGIQALNPKTLGGYPTRDNDIEADFTADDTGRYPDLPEELKKDQLFRGDTARRTDFGSVLQAYCRNRNRDRIIANWGHEAYLAPAYDDGGVIGSRIALFAGPADRALETLGDIELAEGLPHPLLDGVWAKTSPAATASYLIVDFGESNLDQAVEMTRRAGLRYLYHSSPFETWGHFRLKPGLFPNGWDGLKDCVDRARKAGVRIGFHTLSNFITPNDPYVTPRPDPRLARIGASQLAADIDAEQKEIPLAAPEFFLKATTLDTVVVGDELVRYAGVSKEAPWRLLDCRRGAWGTRASAHAAGAPIAKLMDHGYEVFLTDASLTREVALNLARLCNHTRTLQISLDGLEGAWSTGMGQYGRTLFARTWYDGLLPELKGTVNDASNPGHFNWHGYTRMNWGEPWYAGFRESQTLYRFKNQLHFDRNLMPRMLGWFALRPDTSLADAEWLLARAAGFDAGFALASSLASTAQLAADPSSVDAARHYGATPAILAAIREWEAARMARAFPPALRAALRDNSREFHLEPVEPGAWDLVEVHTARFEHPASRPEPTRVACPLEATRETLRWVLRSTAEQPVANVTLALEDEPVFDLEGQPLPPGGSLSFLGGSDVVLCDRTWKELARLPAKTSGRPADRPIRGISFGCGSAPSTNGVLKLELRTFGVPQRLRAAHGRTDGT